MAEIIVGRNPVLEALRAGRLIQKILPARNISRHSFTAEIVCLAQSKGIPVEYVPAETFWEHSGTVRNQGVIAYTAVKEYYSLEDLFRMSREKGELPLYCVLPGNSVLVSTGNTVLDPSEPSSIAPLLILKGGKQKILGNTPPRAPQKRQSPSCLPKRT